MYENPRITPHELVQADAEASSEVRELDLREYGESYSPPQYLNHPRVRPEAEEHKEPGEIVYKADPDAPENAGYKIRPDLNEPYGQVKMNWQDANGSENYAPAHTPIRESKPR